MRGSHLERKSGKCWRSGLRWFRPAPPGAGAIVVLLVVLSAGCGLGGDADSGSTPVIRPGQITRPAGIGLPLDNPQAVQAFTRAEQLLIDWFFRRDIDAALSHFSSDLRPNQQSLLQDTNVKDDCLFVQVEGSSPDANGTVLARYEIRECRITPPDAAAASHIKIIVTITDQNAWITGVEFEEG